MEATAIKIITKTKIISDFFFAVDLTFEKIVGIMKANTQTILNAFGETSLHDDVCFRFNLIIFMMTMRSQRRGSGVFSSD